MPTTDTTTNRAFTLRLGRITLVEFRLDRNEPRLILLGRITLTPPVLVLGALVALFLLFNYPGLGLLTALWNSDSNYGHGYLIPFIAGYFVWTTKSDLLKLDARPCLWGLALFLIALPLRFLAPLLASPVVAGWGVVLMANGLVLYLGGRRVYRAMWLPAAYLVFMVPLPQELYNALAGPLQHFASIVSAALLDGPLGIPTIRRGNIIELAGHTLQVADACSGMRSIMGLLALGVAFAYFWERPLWERLVLVVSTVPIAILANICRVTGTGVMYHLGYAHFAQGFYHEFTGWFVFIFAMVLFLFEAWLMGRLFVYDRDRATTAPDAPGPSGTPAAQGYCVPFLGPAPAETPKRYAVPFHYYLALGALVVVFGLGELWFRVLVQYGVGENVPLAKELKTIPLTIGEWSGRDLPMRGDTEMRVGAMDALQRTYARTRGGRTDELMLYIAYFGGIRGTAPHHPDVCMPGAGWDILGREMPTLRLSGFGDADLEVHKDLFEYRADQQKRLVVWWEYIHGENVASRTMQRLRWVLPKALGGKRGSILQVTVAQDFTGDVDPCWTAITEFIDRLGPHIRQVLPKANKAEGRRSKAEGRIAADRRSSFGLRPYALDLAVLHCLLLRPLTFNLHEE